MAGSRISQLYDTVCIRLEWRNGKKSIIEKILSGIAEVIGASSDKVILRLL
jgi:hypothetical protein